MYWAILPVPWRWPVRQQNRNKRINKIYKEGTEKPDETAEVRPFFVYVNDSIAKKEIYNESIER